MGHDGYKHVSRLVPKSPKVLSALLILAAIVNPAVCTYSNPVLRFY